MNALRTIFLFILCFIFSAANGFAVEDATHPLPPDVTPVEHDSKLFRADPSYESHPYDAEKQVAIYGDKHANLTARPLLELGRELYVTGPFQPGKNLIGKRNLLFPHVHAFGDYRVAIAYNDNGRNEKWTLANRLNLDVDVQLTATERVHAFFRPLDKNGKFTRFDFGADTKNEFDGQLDGNVDALFFEGDLGAIVGGITNQPSPLDMPFAVGRIPMIFQNGVWVEDAFDGFAYTIPARNSSTFGISNMDVTFFTGLSRVTTKAIVKNNGDLDDESGKVYGLNAFIEANQGYWEVGYGFMDAKDDVDEPRDDMDYHNAAVAFTRRYWDLFSNSVRFIWNFGQDRRANLPQTADGYLILIENSLITPKPLTLLPYFNMFFGFDRPQSLARDAGAGGVLKNTGILFETDGLTGFPKMDDTAQDTWGGAFGVEYLFDLHQQIVLETAFVDDMGDSITRGKQYGLGLRYQLPLTNALIFRADLISAWREDDDDLFGVRFELRRKF